MTARRWAWERLTFTVGAMVIVLAITGFITAAASNRSAFSSASVGVALCLVATATPRGQPSSGLVVTTAVALAASGIAASVGALAKLFDLSRSDHVDHRWTIACHISTAAVLAAYILAVPRLTRPSEALTTPVPRTDGPDPSASQRPFRSRYGRRR